MRAALHRALLQAWTRRGPLAILLLPLAWVYGLLAGLRRLLYRLAILRTRRVPVPVVVVGNLVVGGAGKTPVVMELVTRLAAQGWVPGVVSRGYGRQCVACREVHDDSSVAESGDEALLIRRRTGVPVFVAARRHVAALQLLVQYPNVNILLSDDGLQHLALHRDVEICVFDERGVGNGWLLPAGPLREPWPRDCDLIVDAGTLVAPRRFTVLRKLADHATKLNGEQVALAALGRHADGAPASVWAVAGIARPEQFFAMLRTRGVMLAGTTALADHGDIKGHDLVPAVGHLLVCTEKDAAKVWALRPDALAVVLQLDIEAAFWSAFEEKLAAATSA